MKGTIVPSELLAQEALEMMDSPKQRIRVQLRSLAEVKTLKECAAELSDIPIGHLATSIKRAKMCWVSEWDHELIVSLLRDTVANAGLNCEVELKQVSSDD